MTCVLRGTWLGNHIFQHADFNFLCQEQLGNAETLSASARSVQKKPKFSDFFLAIAGGNMLTFPHAFDAGTQDGLPFTCPGDLVARGAASPWQLDDGIRR